MGIGNSIVSIIVGSSVAEISIGMFLGLLGSCTISTLVAIRVVNRVVGDCVNGEGSRVRLKLVGEFVSNSNIVAFFPLKSRLQNNGLAVYALLETGLMFFSFLIITFYL